VRIATPVVASISDAELKQAYARAARNPAGFAKETALVARIEKAAASGNQTAQGIMKFLQSVRPSAVAQSPRIEPAVRTQPPRVAPVPLPVSSSQVVSRPSSSSLQVVPSARPASSSQVVQPVRITAPVVAPISDAELKRVYTRASRNPAGVAKETALVARIERAAANGNQTAQGIMKFLQNVR
jgi:hypothetical protein